MLVEPTLLTMQVAHISIYSWCIKLVYLQYSAILLLKGFLVVQFLFYWVHLLHHCGEFLRIQYCYDETEQIVSALVLIDVEQQLLEITVTLKREKTLEEIVCMEQLN